jgi:hypothetical protein
VVCFAGGSCFLPHAAVIQISQAAVAARNMQAIYHARSQPSFALTPRRTGIGQAAPAPPGRALPDDLQGRRACSAGVRFALREGGRTIGAGVVTATQ